MKENIETRGIHQEIMTFFGLGTISESISAGGHANSNYFVKTNTGEYFLKIIKERTILNEIITEFDFVEKIQSEGITLLPYIKKRNGDILYQSLGIFAVVQKRLFIEQARKITPMLINQIGTQLASLHTIKIKDMPDRMHWLHPEWLVAAKKFANGTKDTKGITLLLEEEEKLPDWKTFPQSIIHGDIHRGNLLVDEQKLVAIIDWEEVGLGARILDFAMTFAGTCYRYDDGFQEDIFREFYNAYTKIIPFTQKEIDAIPEALKAVCIHMDLWEHQRWYTDEEKKWKMKDGVYLRYGADDWKLPNLLGK